MVCERCKQEHDGNFGSGRFCSRKCSNSRTWSKEDKLKKSISSKKSEKVKVANQRVRSKDEIQKQVLKAQETWIKKLLNDDFETLTEERRRKRVIYEQKNKCFNCGISEWLNKPITLELEHIDGNHYNNNRKNTIALCPNCHSQTDTWRGRNKNKNRCKYSDKEIIETFLNSENIHQTLIKLKMAPKGDNYSRIRKIVGDI